jgi:hypothetical protein
VDKLSRLLLAMAMTTIGVGLGHADDFLPCGGELRIEEDTEDTWHAPY